MDITVELQSGVDRITVEPASCTITNAVCNDSLQHVENSCEIKLIYDPDLFEFIVSHEQMPAVVKNRGGEVLFTGTAGADTSWEDRGEPHPIENFSLSIKDYTSKLDIQNGDEIALLDTTLAAVLRRLASDCGLAMVAGNVPSVGLEAFIMPVGRNYRQTLDALCYQYLLAFYFDSLGRVNFFCFGDIPDSAEPLGQADILAGAKIKKSRKRYDAVQVEYSTLSKKKNEQIYFESFGYDSDNAPSPVVIQPGVYYPFDSAPEIEAAEGQVYQSFVSGYAESRKKYNGELEYRRSRDTSLLYASKHSVARDWEGPLAIDRTGFESLRSSVRFRNAGTADAKLRQFAIRADAVYRNKAATVSAGHGPKERSFSTSAEFVHSAVYAENLAQALCRYFSRSGLAIDLSTDALPIAPGSYRSIDAGKSGLMATALVLSQTLDCEKEIYSFKAISVGPAAVDVRRFKSAESDPAKGDPGKDGEDGEDGKPGPAGAAGNYYQSIYRRAAARPATPSGNDPSGWASDPSSHSGTDPLWMSRGIKNAASVLQGAWSVPVQISGEDGKDGLGLDAMPRDPYAHWSCDGLPEMPDDPAGTGFRQSFFNAGLPWSVNGSIASSFPNNKLRIQCKAGLSGYFAFTTSRVFICKLAVETGQVVIGWEQRGPNVCSKGDHFICAVKPNDNQEPLIIYGTETGAVFEISEVYIGNGSYLTPITDNSGNGRHIALNGGSVPKRGKGLLFTGTKAVSVSGILNGHSGDFAVSAWTNKPHRIIDKRGGSYSMGFGIRNGRAYFISSSPNAEIYAGTAFAEDGLMHHLVAMVKEKILYLYVDGKRSGQASVSTYYTKPLENHAFMMGGASDGEIAPHGTVIDEIAVFDRALTDREIEALSKAPLPKAYDPAASHTARYLGKTAAPTSSAMVTIQAPSSQIVRAGEGDWVSYVGADQSGAGIWKKGYCMRWTGVAWERVDPAQSSETALYMGALADLCDGAPDSAFSALLVKKLMAQEAAIDALRTRLIELEDSGQIRSKGFAGIDGPTPGFWLKAYDAATRGGLIEANNIRVKNGEFEGKLCAGKIWDKNGNVIYTGASSFGGFFSDSGSHAEPRIQMANAVLYGTVKIGAQIPGSQAPQQILFNTTRTVPEGCNIRTHITIYGTYKLDNLKSEIASLKIKCGSSHYDAAPVTGCIYHPRANTNDTEYDIIVSHMTINSSNNYVIHGISNKNVISKVISGTETVTVSLCFF